ncbi:MAG: cytochrome P460 family protein [Campylobacterota bacterium]|nr:cytochrome P460 family protein [Campylobacterota bacterium]
MSSTFSDFTNERGVQNYKDNKFKMLGIKYKKKSYDIKSGDWYWIKVKPSSEVKKAGAIKGCIDCHAHARAADFVHAGHNFEYPLPKKK